jgi:hypothetical protein
MPLREHASNFEAQYIVQFMESSRFERNDEATVLGGE